MKIKELMSMIGLIVVTVFQANGQQENLLKLDQNWLDSKKEVFSNDESKSRLLPNSAEASSINFSKPLLLRAKEEFKKQRIRPQGQRRFHARTGQFNVQGMSPMPKAMIDDSVDYHLLIKKIE